MHCNTVRAKVHSPLFSAALQDRLTEGSVSLQSHLWSSALIKLCGDPAQMHCSTVQGRMHSPLFSAALQNRLTVGSMSMQLHLWRLALHTGVQ